MSVRSCVGAHYFADTGGDDTVERGPCIFLCRTGMALKKADERGSSVLIFIIALPLLVLFLFAILDIGRTVFLHIAMDDAVHAACRVAVSAPAGAVTQAKLREAAFVASPALAADGVSVSVEATYGDVQTASYAHRLFNEDSGLFEERISQTEKREVVVALALEGRYLTPLGSALSVAQGRVDAGFSYEAETTGVLDTTVEGGSW